MSASVRPAPADPHSVVSNPDRFEPLQAVARSLVDDLAANYDVTVSWAAASSTAMPWAPKFSRAGVELREAVLLAPRDPRSASIAIGFTTFPGVIVRAGALHEFVFPACGCDASDEQVDDLANRLGDVVRTVVGGGYSEEIDGSMVSYSLRHASGWQYGECHSGEFPAERLADARAVLAGVQDGWAPWARREVQAG